MTTHENQKAIIAYNPEGHRGIIIATGPNSIADREVNELSADVYEHNIEGALWSGITEPVLSVWEGVITELIDEDGGEVEWVGTFRRAEVRDLIEFGLLLEETRADRT